MVVGILLQSTNTEIVGVVVVAAAAVVVVVIDDNIDYVRSRVVVMLAAGTADWHFDRPDWIRSSMVAVVGSMLRQRCLGCRQVDYRWTQGMTVAFAAAAAFAPVDDVAQWHVGPSVR